MLKGKDDDHKHSTCDPKGANIDAQKHHFRFQKKWSAVGAHCRYTRVYLLTADAKAEADGLFAMSESFQDNRLYLADMIPASRC